MRYKLIPLILLSLIAVGCNNTSSKKPKTEEYDIYSVDIRELDFTSSIQSNTARETFLNKLTPYFSDSTDGFVTSLDPTGPVQLFYKELTNGDLIKCLMLSSSNETAGDGSLTINFSKKLSKLKLYAAGQYSYNYQQIPVCDGYNVLIVDNQPAWVVTPYDINNKVSVVDEKEFVINNTAVNLQGIGSQRAFLYKLDFYFAK